MNDVWTKNHNEIFHPSEVRRVKEIYIITTSKYEEDFNKNTKGLRPARDAENDTQKKKKKTAQNEE